VRPILETCRPRNDLLTGAFNPEIFTAVLSQVLEYYRGNTNVTQNIYTDAEAFFTEATYPTQGMKSVLSDVFGRLTGDNSLPAIHRLETAFGGGKTHTLIACTHLGFRGRELAPITREILDPALLPAPGEVVVVGVAGDEIPVHKPRGKALIPYTLWGEVAFQVGGKKLYSEVEEEVTSQAAPGRTYFERVLGGCRVLIMLDELAQYATRLEAARARGAEQLAAFLMGLHGYARSHAGIAIVLTLASQKDAFATQTRMLTELLAHVRGAACSGRR
jgi:predicted AAA+ superfamily ATPase